MSIRPMTPAEIVAGLRRAAAICIEQQRSDWISLGVCRADGTFDAAFKGLDTWDMGDARTPDQAAFFLLLCAEAHDV